MKKILHIQLMPILSGAQKVCLDEIENLGKNYEQWLLCSGVGPFTKKASEFGVKHIVVDNLKREISIRDDLLALFKIYQNIKNKKFDIVHTHSSKTGFLGRVAARCAGVKTIVHTVHGFA
ncbi:glycosyltransferase, partial [Escherichia coli]